MSTQSDFETCQPIFALKDSGWLLTVTLLPHFSTLKGVEKVSKFPTNVKVVSSSLLNWAI